MGIDRRREGFSEEFTNDDLRPEDYERLMDKSQKMSQIANPDDSRLDEQDENGKYCEDYDYPASNKNDDYCM
ncbi:MAG: hypothetical protein MR423_02240 [Firmicutes bacterium]|nr:hypothetical protein [Bacillota bacterium]MDY3659083.1 hypothetical protein [Eubacteriales bacterium]